jgi:Ran GTPase-activating protein (RanGAP) involved in mRNA processing and transport
MINVAAAIQGSEAAVSQRLPVASATIESLMTRLSLFRACHSSIFSRALLPFAGVSDTCRAALRALDGSGFDLDGPPLQQLCNALPLLPQLQSLKMVGCELGDDDARVLARVLPSLPSLTTLDLRNNEISGAGAVALAAVLPLIPQLAVLGLSGNDFGPEGMAALAPALVRIPALRELRLASCLIGDTGVQALSAALSCTIGSSPTGAVITATSTTGTACTTTGCVPWTELDIRNNRITDAGIMTLFAALRAGASPQLDTLKLGQNVFHLWQSIFNELEQIPQVTTLALSMEDCFLVPRAGWSGFAKLRLGSLGIGLRGDRYRQADGSATTGILAFAAELRSLVSLHVLSLGPTTLLDDKCASALASSLISLPQLTKLKLSACLRGVSAKPLAQLWGCAPLLDTLIADDNNFDASTLAAGLQALPRTLQHLSLAQNGLSGSRGGGMDAVVAALPTLPQLAVLDLSRNAIDDDEAAALAAALPSLPQLTMLNLFVNHIGDDGATALAATFVSGGE